MSTHTMNRTSARRLAMAAIGVAAALSMTGCSVMGIETKGGGDDSQPQQTQQDDSNAGSDEDDSSNDSGGDTSNDADSDGSGDAASGTDTDSSNNGSGNDSSNNDSNSGSGNNDSNDSSGGAGAGTADGSESNSGAGSSAGYSSNRSVRVSGPRLAADVKKTAEQRSGQTGIRVTCRDMLVDAKYGGSTTCTMTMPGGKKYFPVAKGKLGSGNRVSYKLEFPGVDF